MSRNEFIPEWSMEPEDVRSGQRHIALVGHDHMKTDLADWAVHNRTLLARHRIYASGTTGQFVMSVADH